VVNVNGIPRDARFWACEFCTTGIVHLILIEIEVLSDPRVSSVLMWCCFYFSIFGGCIVHSIKITWCEHDVTNVVR